VSLERSTAELARLQDLFRSLFEPGFGGGDELEVTFDSEADCWNGLWCGIRSAGNTCEEAAIATVSAVMMHRSAELARAMKERDHLRERNKELLAVLKDTLDSLRSLQAACAFAGMSPRVYAGHGERAKKIIAESKDAEIERASAEEVRFHVEIPGHDHP
jgi:hypothetical protein